MAVNRLFTKDEYMEEQAAKEAKFNVCSYNLDPDLGVYISIYGDGDVFASVCSLVFDDDWDILGWQEEDQEDEYCGKWKFNLWIGKFNPFDYPNGEDIDEFFEDKNVVEAINSLMDNWVACAGIKDSPQVNRLKELGDAHGSRK